MAAKTLAIATPPGYERTYKRIECDLPKYKAGGYYAEFWIDYPMYVVQKIARAANSGDEDAMLDAFKEAPVIKSWNIVDYQGDVLPLPSEDPQSLYKMPGPLMGWIFDTIRAAPRLSLDTEEVGKS